MRSSFAAQGCAACVVPWPLTPTRLACRVPSAVPSTTSTATHKHVTMGLLDLNNDVISRGCAGALLAAMFGIFVAVTVVPSPSNIMAADQKDALAAIVPGDV